MKILVYLLFFGLSTGCIAQNKSLVALPEIPQEKDSVKDYSIGEIVIDLQQENYKKDMIILRNRLRRVYPYARATADNLIILNENLQKIESKAEKRRYIHRSQKYLESQFKERLKKLSRNDGKILLKLIHRQTGQTAFSLIKEFKSGWTAFWSNTTAKTFSLNLKSQYDPLLDLEDFFIETQLQYLFFNFELDHTHGQPPIDYRKVLKYWQENLPEDEFFPPELR
ncbi:DUF4294 domain-containing protein [Myroides sp. LJL119]